MGVGSGLLVAVLALSATAIGPGDHQRTVAGDGEPRSYLLHVPPNYDPRTPIPVVVAFHPFATNAYLMAAMSGLTELADEKGFIAVFPNGTGKSKVFLAWTEGGMAEKADDLGYIARVLDDVEAIANVDRRRVYATGMSNGAMMCNRVASEFSDRIAAIAVVAGTVAFDECKARRPVPVLQFHGSNDTIVPYGGPTWRTPKTVHFKSVDESIRIWVKANGCPEIPVAADVPRRLNDGLTVKRLTYGPGRDGSEVVLYRIDGGGHTWPGRDLRAGFLGKSAMDLSANELMWEFFTKHPMK